MLKKILVVGAVAAAVLGFASVPAEAYSGPPAGAPCSVGSRSTACFAHYGDHIWVKDTKKDGYAGVGIWVYSSDINSPRYCVNTNGADGAWKDCNFEMTEHVEIRFRTYARENPNDNDSFVSGSGGSLMFVNTSG